MIPLYFLVGFTAFMAGAAVTYLICGMNYDNGWAGGYAVGRYAGRNAERDAATADRAVRMRRGIPMPNVHLKPLDYDFDKLDIVVCPQAAKIAAMFPIQEGY